MPTNLHDSWTALTDRLDGGGVLDRWTQLEPALHCAPTIGDLRTAIRADRAGGDVLMGCLVRLAAADGHDDADAVMVLIHLLDPGARSLARRFANQFTDPYDTVIGEMVIAIRSFPLRRSRAFAANILGETTKALCVDRRMIRTRQRVQVQLVAPAASRDDGGYAGVSRLDQPTFDAHHRDDDDITLSDLLSWALTRGIVTETSVALLLEVHTLRAADPRGRNREKVAAAHGMAAITVDRHCAKALRALQAAAPQYLRERDCPWTAPAAA